MDAILDLIPPKIAAHLPLSNAGYVYREGAELIDFSQRSLWIAAGAIVFNPLYWNILARKEYRSKVLSKTLGGSLPATYFFFVTIFSLGILRDHLYQNALKDQPHLELLAQPIVKWIAASLFISGQVFVLTSMWALGLVGTYLGDYCGILMKERVTCFPFNVLEDPMYDGSTLCFLGTALWYESPAGLLLTALVYVVYQIALRYEGPFTAAIYSTAAQKAFDEAAAKIQVPTQTTPKKAAPAVRAVATPSPPSTPRRSGRVSTARSATATATATASATNGSLTPRRGRKSVATDTLSAASPMRVTRSRSKALESGEETN